MDIAAGDGPIRHAGLTPLQRKLSLAAVIASTVGMGVAFGIGYPITALAFAAWGAPNWLNGLAGSMPSLAILLGLPFFPRLAGSVGTVRSMVLGCVLVAASFLLMPVLPGPAAWLALRFLTGAGLALPWLVGETWINLVAAEHSRGRILALYSIVVFSGFALGPLILDLTGIGGWLPFVIGAGSALWAAVPILAARALAPSLPAHPRTGVWGAVRLAPAAILAGGLGGFLELGHFAMLPIYALGLGASEAEALRLLTVFMVGGIALQFLIGWLADRASAERVLLASLVSFAGVASLLPWLGELVARVAMVFLMGGLVIGLYTLGLAFIGQRVPSRDLAVANAAFLMAYQVGAMVGPVIGGGAMTAWPPHGFVAAMITAATAGALLLWRMGSAAPRDADDGGYASRSSGGRPGRGR